MILFLIIGICVGALAVDFAMQNTATVTVAIFPWQFSAPLALVIIGAVILGLVLAVIAMIPAAIREKLDAFAARREARKVETTHESNSYDQAIA